MLCRHFLQTFALCPGQKAHLRHLQLWFNDKHRDGLKHDVITEVEGRNMKCTCKRDIMVVAQTLGAHFEHIALDTPREGGGWNEWPAQPSRCRRPLPLCLACQKPSSSFQPTSGCKTQKPKA